MKKFLFLAFLPMLLLTGCAAGNQVEPTVTLQTEPSGFYVGASNIEQLTGGAVRLYELPDGGFSGLCSIGDRLLLISRDDPAELTVLTGAAGVLTEQISIDPDLLSANSRVLDDGFAYFDQAENRAVFLDSRLKEVKRISLPEDLQGEPVFAPDGKEIFYSIGNEIRALDVERKISRLIKAHSFDTLILLDSYFDGTLLSCRVTDKRDGENTIYVSAQTGQTMYTENGITALHTYGKDYFVQRKNGIVEQTIFGNLEGSAQAIKITEPNVAAALELGGAVGYAAQDNGLSLVYYDLSLGQKTAEVVMEDVGKPLAFLPDCLSDCIWILTVDAESGCKRLLRWDRKLSAVEADTPCFGTLYTAQSPDQAGLNACADRVTALNQEHGVQIRIWQDAVKQTGGHKMVAEHQALAIHTVLDQLEPVLQEFPKGFLQKAISSRIRICVVRSIDREMKAVHYWHEDDVYIALSAGVDVREAFLLGLGYVVDSHVLGNSVKYDYWNPLNPEGFAYGTADETYLSGEDRAFADAVSMMSATDDRSRIFYEAMRRDNADLFRYPRMQEKLLLVCQGIRDAWDWKRKDVDYPWEQYLTQSIAYKGKR